MKRNRLIPLSLLAASVLAACSAVPERNVQLEEARSNFATAQADPQVAKLAGNELKQASDALNKANEAWAKREETGQVNQLAYLAKQRIAISQEAAKLRTAEEAVTNANAQRDKVRLSARTKEADKAQRNADASQLQSQISQQQSEESQRLAALQQQRASDAESRSRQLEGQLQELQAKKTDRGLVVTLGDVLFDTDKAKLKAGGTRNVKKLADVLKDNPEAHVSVEGFTDSVGNDSYNQQLSERRANAVGEALQAMGVSAGRIVEHGYGETAPVADNNTAEGRQLNRRVEVIISNDAGRIAPR